MLCKYVANLQEEIHMEIWFQKKLHRTSAWMLHFKFPSDLQNYSGELLLYFISFVLVQVINNLFYWLTFIIYLPKFVDWSKLFWKQLQQAIGKLFRKIYYKTKKIILWCIFRNNFRIACCNWSTHYILISIFSQKNNYCNYRSSPPQVFFKKDNLIYTFYKCEEE